MIEKLIAEFPWMKHPSLPVGWVVGKVVDDNTTHAGLNVPNNAVYCVVPEALLVGSASPNLCFVVSRTCGAALLPDVQGRAWCPLCEEKMTDDFEFVATDGGWGNTPDEAVASFMEDVFPYPVRGSIIEGDKEIEYRQEVSPDNVMKEMQELGLLNKEAEEFFAFYSALTGDLVSENPFVVQAVRTLNLKLIPAGLQLGKITLSEAPWLPDFGVDGAGEEQKRMWREVNKYLYSTDFNAPRDFLRRALKITHSNWSGENLEVFADRELLPRNEGESSSAARKRHLAEGTIPHKDVLVKLINARSLGEYSTLLPGLETFWLELEALLASFSSKELNQAGKADWLKGVRLEIPLRAEKIRAIRAMRDNQPRYGWK